MKNMFDTFEQFRDWKVLQTAIEEADGIPPCTNFPDAWFPDYKVNHDSVGNEAVKMCKTQCPVVNECAIYGIKWEREGIWGGMRSTERQKLRGLGRGQKINGRKTNAI